MMARLSFDELKWLLKYYWKVKNVLALQSKVGLALL